MPGAEDGGGPDDVAAFDRQDAAEEGGAGRSDVLLGDVRHDEHFRRGHRPRLRATGYQLPFEDEARLRRRRQDGCGAWTEARRHIYTCVFLGSLDITFAISVALPATDVKGRRLKRGRARERRL